MQVLDFKIPDLLVVNGMPQVKHMLSARLYAGYWDLKTNMAHLGIPRWSWLGLWALTAEGAGSIPGQGTKMPQVTWPNQKTSTWHM